MKKIAVYAILQGIVIFLITGLITQLVRGDFFFRNLAPIFGVLAAIMRPQPYTMKRQNKRKLLPGKKLNKRTVFSGKISGKALI